MEKIELSFDRNEFNKRMQPFNDLLPELNNIVAAYNELGLPSLTTKNDLVNLINDVKGFVFDKMTIGKDINIAGIQIKSDKAFDLMNKPKGFDKLFHLIEVFISKPHSYNKLSNFDLVENEVVIAESFVQKNQESCSLYAETDEEKKMLEFAQTILKEGERIFGKGNVPLYDLPILFLNDLNTHEWKISGHAVKYNYYVSKMNNAKGVPNYQ